MRDELAELHVLKASTTPATTTGAAHRSARRMDTTPRVAGSNAEDILKSKKSKRKSYTAGFPVNEPNDECSNCVSLKCYRACTDTYVIPSSRFHARSSVLDQVFVPDTTDSILDSGVMSHIINFKSTTNTRVKVFPFRRIFG